MPASYSYPKEEKLKSRAAIDALFTDGRSVSVHPLRLVYRKSEDHPAIRFGVSVSKRNFKHAVDRNYIKRVLREAYRHNKSILEPASAFDFMLIYQSRNRTDYRELLQRTEDLFLRFIRKELPPPDVK